MTLTNNIQRIKQATQTLNQMSEQATTYIREINTTLKECNPGITIWHPTTHDNHTLGYAKGDDGNWGLVLSYTKNNKTEWIRQLDSAPRILRIKFATHIPEQTAQITDPPHPPPTKQPI